MNIRALSLLTAAAFCLPCRAQEAEEKPVRPRADSAVDDKSPALVPAPPFAAAPAKDPGAAERKIPKLKLLSAKANAVTDDDKWMEANKIAPVFIEVPNAAMNKKGELPAGVPETLGGLMAVRAFKGGDFGFIVYGADFSSGSVLAVWDAAFSKLAATLDFSAWTKGPKAKTAAEEDFIFQQLTYAQIADDVLYVSHAHSTYAASSGGKNAWISAISMGDGKLLWRSAPLVANCANFILSGDGILTGYGFTDEDDFLYVLNRHTGATASKVKVKSGPSLMSLQDKTLIVRTYNTDYKFTVE